MKLTHIEAKIVLFIKFEPKDTREQILLHQLTSLINNIKIDFFIVGMVLALQNKISSQQKLNKSEKYHLKVKR